LPFLLTAMCSGISIPRAHTTEVGSPVTGTTWQGAPGVGKGRSAGGRE